MFSKFAKIKENNIPILTWTDFFDNNVDLKKYKMPELKNISRFYNLRLTGTKPKLMENITFFFNKNRYSSKIQRIFRGYIVRYSIILRGCGFKNRSNCVNETDFYTLEPLIEIPNEFFYSYTDSNNFSYGFNIQSLITMIRKQGKTIMNPYNRELINPEIINNIFSLANLIDIIFFSYYSNDINNNENITNEENGVVNIFANNNTNIVYDINDSFNMNRIQNSLQPRHSIISKIINIRNNPIERRIQDVFIEIDILGNYTQCSWFSNLDRISYCRFYQYMYYIWFTSGMLTYQIKREICPFFDPFVFQIQHTMNPSLPTTDINDGRSFCLSIIENLVYGGIDIEYRKIGVLHILSALTMVSTPARNSMDWLYESLNSSIPQ